MNYIKGNYSRSIYENGAGYYIGLFKVKETNSDVLSDYVGKTITFTGYFHELNDTDTYMFYGKLVNHPKYGEQFQVDSYERCKPEEKDSIIEFLTSGLFKGIGEKKAKQIVDVLGKSTLKIILEEPNNLLLIPGITKKNIDTLHNKLKEYEASYESIMYMQDIGFTTKESMLIYNFYKKDTKKTIEKNIYLISKDIREINFKKVDNIAIKMGIELDAEIRVKAAILYILEEVCNLVGHSYLSFEEIYNYLPRVLKKEVLEDNVIKVLNKLEKDLEIIIKQNRYYLKEMYEAETLIVKRFRLLNSKKDNKISKIDTHIHEIEKLFNIEYNKDQLKALIRSMEKEFLIITGGPGTGKTTIMKGIVELYRNVNNLSYEKLIQKIALLAPTGRAAKRISETTIMPASTIHRFLKWSKETNTFQVNEYNKSKVEFIVLDEASMVDTYLMANLLKGISSNCKIIIIGDDHQLPSVGPGQVLHDLISSEKLEVVELNQLYRQKDDSNIITLAYDIRNKKIDKSIFNVSEDLTFIECNDNDVINNISEIANTYKDLSYKDFQILSPMYKGLNGIDNINKIVREIFNPKDDNKKEYRLSEVLLREDDKVIQLTNMPEENVYNGDIGLIDRISNGTKKEIYVDYDSNLVKYTPSNFNNIRQAYAISIHKAQGSEFDVVVLPIVKGFNKMLYQKLIYTAVTRAKKKLYIVGDIKALEYASENTNNDIRKTTIKDYLINGID